MGKKLQNKIVDNSAMIEYCNKIPNFYPKMLIDASEGTINKGYIYELFNNEKVVTENYAKKIVKVLEKFNVRVEYWEIMGWIRDKEE